MIQAARRNARWRAHPIGCPCTGRVVQVVLRVLLPQSGKKFKP
jgi:hypothetical protein